jgi:hypothetical protein
MPMSDFNPHSGNPSSRLCHQDGLGMVDWTVVVLAIGSAVVDKRQVAICTSRLLAWLRIDPEVVDYLVSFRLLVVVMCEVVAVVDNRLVGI